MSGVWFYICDHCGDVVDIGDRHAENGPEWACEKCGGTALWEFDDKEHARVFGLQIMQKRFAAKMAGLDQAKARLADLERGS